MGKRTVGYETYVKVVPKWKRVRGQPRTPDKHSNCSKRSWDGQVRKWRRLLHEYDGVVLVQNKDGQTVPLNPLPKVIIPDGPTVKPARKGKPAKAAADVPPTPAPTPVLTAASS